jgi:hypothetical protein
MLSCPSLWSSARALQSNRSQSVRSVFLKNQGVLLELAKLLAINKAMAKKAIPRIAKMSLRFILHVFKQREGHANAAKLAKTVPNPVYSESQ